MTSDRNQAARALLAFYLEAGVDAVLSESPVDRFADPAGARPAAGNRASRRTTRSLHRAAAPRSTVPAGRCARGGARPAVSRSAVMAAREEAKNAATLEELRAILDGFAGCALRATATQLVFADGNPQARVMFVGEAPGRDEDIEGLPFVGRSGKLLDRMMAAIGLDRADAYIANIVPWRPPGNRTPTPQESAICLPFIAAPDRARRSRRAGLPGRAFGADAARHPGRHPEDPRPLVHVSDRHARNPRHGDPASGLSAAPAAAEAARLAGFSGDQEGAGGLSDAQTTPHPAART